MKTKCPSRLDEDVTRPPSEIRAKCTHRTTYVMLPLPFGSDARLDL